MASTSMGGQYTDAQIAVLIDYENVGLNSIQWLFDQMSDIGRIIVKRAYADWSKESKSRDQLLELGIEPIQLFRSDSSKKNASDIRLAIDAIELLHQSPVDTFVIVSSDSDFAPLASKLRSAGKVVIGAGYESTASRILITSCDRYYHFPQINVTPAVTKSSQKKQKKTDVKKLVQRAVQASINEQGKVLGSKLNQTLQRLDPSFDYRSLGFSTFTKFLDSIEWLKVTRPEGSGDTTIEMIDSNLLFSSESQSQDAWDVKVDHLWSERVKKPGQSIPGPTAAGDAAKILGLNKLSSSQFKNLQGLIDSSDTLNKNWLRKGNTVRKR